MYKYKCAHYVLCINCVYRAYIGRLQNMWRVFRMYIERKSADPASLWPRQGGAWDHRRCGALLGGETINKATPWCGWPAECGKREIPSRTLLSLGPESDQKNRSTYDGLGPPSYLPRASEGNRTGCPFQGRKSDWPPAPWFGTPKRQNASSDLTLWGPSVSWPASAPLNLGTYFPLSPCGTCAPEAP